MADEKEKILTEDELAAEFDREAAKILIPPYRNVLRGGLRDLDSIDYRDRDELLLAAISSGDTNLIGDPRERFEKFIKAIANEIHSIVAPTLISYKIKEQVTITANGYGTVTFTDCQNPEDFPDNFTGSKVYGAVEYFDTDKAGLVVSAWTVIPYGNQTYPNGGLTVRFKNTTSTQIVVTPQYGGASLIYV